MNREGPLEQIGSKEYRLLAQSAAITVANVRLHLMIVGDGEGRFRLEIDAIERYRAGQEGGTHHTATLLLPLDMGEPQ